MQATEVSIARFFDPDEVEVMGRKSRFVQRRSPVTGMRFLLTITTGLLNTPDGTLGQLAAFPGATCRAPVSPQAVDERINPMARKFLEMCLSRALEMAATIPRGTGDVLEQFDHVYVIDSTNFELHPPSPRISRAMAVAPPRPPCAFSSPSTTATRRPRQRPDR